MDRLLLVVSALAVGVQLVPVTPVRSPVGGVAASMQPSGSIGLRMSGIDFGSETRYSLALAPADGTDLSRLLVEVFLPSGAEFVRAMEAPGRTEFLGATGSTLQWAASFAPDDPVDAFTFFLRRPVTEEIAATVSWGPDESQTGISIVPSLVNAADVQGDAVIPSEGEATVGNTGVRVSAAAGAAAGTPVHVRRLGPAANPPGDLGAFWWCAMVDLSGLPDGSAAFVTVPARQALAPNVEISLFGLQGGTWTPLPERGFVSEEGQFITFVHRGGVVAPGTAPTAQPSASPVAGNPSPGLGAASTAASVAVTPPSGADLRVVSIAFQPGTQVTAGAPVTASVTVRNVGTQPSAAGLLMGTTPPSGLDLAQPLATQPSGDVSCTAQGAGASAPVNCILPSLADGQSRVVIFALRAAGVGGAPCLTVSAQIDAQDPDPSNNSASSCVTITPAGTVDTRVRLQRVGEIVLNQNVTYAATLEVVQGSTSGPVSLNVSIDPGLRIVSWATPGWTCSGSVTASTRECTRSDQMTAPLPFPSVVVTAMATSCSAALRHSVATGQDAVTANNQANVVESTPCPNWNVDLSASIDRLRLQQTQSISAVVRNGGTTASAGSVSFKLALPVELQTNVTAVGSGWTCQPPAPSSAAPTVTCTTSQTIPPSGTTTLTITGQPTTGQGTLGAIGAPSVCPLSVEQANAVFPNPPVDAKGTASGGGAAASAAVTRSVAFQIGVCS